MGIMIGTTIIGRTIEGIMIGTTTGIAVDYTIVGCTIMDTTISTTADQE